MVAAGVKRKLQQIVRRLPVRPLLLGLLALLLLAGWPLLVTETKPLCGLAFSPDGERLAMLRGIPYDFLEPPMRFELAVWDVAAQKEDLVIPLDKPGWGMDFSPDGKTLAYGTHDGEIQLWDAVSGALKHSWSTGATGAVDWLAFAGSNRLLVSNGGEQGPLLWDAVKGDLLAMAPQASTGSYAALQGGRLAVGQFFDRSAGTRKAWLYDLSGGRFELLKTLPSGGGRLALSADGDLLAFDKEPGISVFDLNAERVLRDFGGVRILEMAFSPVANVLAVRSVSTPGRRESVQLLQPQHGKRLDILSGHKLSPFHSFIASGLVRFTPDGGRLAVGSEEGNVRIWDVDSGEKLAELPNAAWGFAQTTLFSSLLLCWCAAWAVSGKRTRWHPAAFIDMVAINALAAALLCTRLLAAGLPYYDPRRPSLLLLLALLAGWLGLAGFWAIFARMRWPVRLAGIVSAASLAWSALYALLAVPELEVMAWALSLGAAILLGCLLSAFGIMRSCGFRVRSSIGRPMPPSEPASQINLRDLLMGTASIAIFFAVARVATLWLPLLELLTPLAIHGACLAFVVATAGGLALGVARLPIQLPPLVTCSAVAGAVTSNFLDRNADAFLLWHVGLYLQVAAVVWGSLVVFRLHGYRLERNPERLQAILGTLRFACGTVRSVLAVRLW